MGVNARVWYGRRKYVTLLVLVGMVILIRLGFWQLERHTQRAARNAVITARINEPAVPLTQVLALPISEQEYRHVSVVCIMQSHQQLLWRNRSYNGTTGYQIITLCQPDSGDAVLINRGWIPYRDGLGDWQARYMPPSGIQTVTGVWRLSQASAQANEAAPVNGWRDKWFALTVPDIASQMQRTLVLGFIELQPDGEASPATYPVRTTITDMGLGSHLGYAIQWFSFAVILVVGALVVAYRTPLDD